MPTVLFQQNNKFWKRTKNCASILMDPRKTVGTGGFRDGRQLEAQDMLRLISYRHHKHRQYKCCIDICIVTLASALNVSKLYAPEMTKTRFLSPHCRLTPNCHASHSNISMNLIPPESRLRGLHFCRWYDDLSVEHRQFSLPPPLFNPKFENVPFALDRWNFAYGERRHWAN